MIGLRRGGAYIGLLLLSACESTRAAPSGDTVTLSRRPWFGICAGVCPNYDVTVGPGGRAWSVLRSFHRPDQVVHLRPTWEQRARFLSLLAPFRPDGRRPERPECDHRLPPEEAPLLVRVTEIEIRWSGASGAAHLIACDTRENAALRAAIDEALLTLDLDIAARPLF